MTLEAEAGASQAHPQQVIRGLSWQWTPQLSGPGLAQESSFLCPGWVGKRKTILAGGERTLSLLMSFNQPDVRHKVLLSFFLN